MIFKKKVPSLILALTLAPILISGCNVSVAETAPLGVTVTKDSKWINSSIEGAIDETVNVRREDDFYTFVNKDIINSLTIAPNEDRVYAILGGSDTIKERILDLLTAKGEEFDGTNQVDMEPSELSHAKLLLSHYGSACLDWDKRDSLGIEPVRKYIDAINNISDLAGMTKYLLNEDGMNFYQRYFLSFDTIIPTFDKSAYVVNLSVDAPLNMINRDSQGETVEMEICVRSVLEKLGYTPAQIDKLIKQNYSIEMEIEDNLNDEADSSYEREFYSLDDIRKLQGSFPLSDILERYGLAASERFMLEQKGFLKALGKMYNTGNLDDLKAYYICHTIMEAANLLDWDTLYDFYRSSELSQEDRNNEEKTKDLAYSMALSDLDLAAQTAYIGSYTSKEEKDYITKIVYECLDFYKDMIRQEEWLSEESREKAVLKLENLAVHALYPDSFESCKDLQFEEEDTLVDIKAKCKTDKLMSRSKLVNRPLNRAYWNLRDFKTTIENAFYTPTQNEIYILCGLACEETFNINNYMEENYGRIGTVIGHEISHSLDSNGANYDENGVPADWWTKRDRDAFKARTDKLAASYNGLTIAPNSGYVMGAQVESETTADIGGIMCLLGVAKKYENFDYDKFFTSYTQLWSSKYKYSYTMAILNDEHPADFIRVNKVLQQFDEFIDTYDIKPGDGMYLDPGDRVRVW